MLEEKFDIFIDRRFSGIFLLHRILLHHSLTVRLFLTGNHLAQDPHASGSVGQALIRTSADISFRFFNFDLEYLERLQSSETLLTKMPRTFCFFRTLGVWNPFFLLASTISFDEIKKSKPIMMMSFSRLIQWYNSHADTIWPDGTFKTNFLNYQYMYMHYSHLETLVVCWQNGSIKTTIIALLAIHFFIFVNIVPRTVLCVFRGKYTVEGNAV